MRFIEYVFYPPLYLAGPTLAFNAFSSQRHSPSTISAKQVRQLSALYDHLLALTVLSAVRPYALSTPC